MTSMSRWCRCVVIFLIVSGPAMGAENHDGTYKGKRVLTKGDNSSCMTEDDVTVTVEGGTLIFTNRALKNFVIGFDPRPDGSFSVIDAETGGAVVSIRGRIVGNTLDADVSNGPCEHHWHLEKS